MHFLCCVDCFVHWFNYGKGYEVLFTLFDKRWPTKGNSFLGKQVMLLLNQTQNIKACPWNLRFCV